MAKQQRNDCGGDCVYLEQWVNNLRNFETISIRWYDREMHTVKGVSGPGKDALKRHAEALTFGRWIHGCNKGCECQGKWQKETVTTIILGDYVHGANVICTADLHKKEYSGKCVPKIEG